jgi:serine/threonine-protein kinase haspin
MPAKQVYGKRATAKTTASFAKFISPDKDVIVEGEHKKNAAKPTRATTRGETKAEVEMLEKEMGDLKLANEYKGVEIGVEKKKRRTRRVVEDEEQKRHGQEVEAPANVIDLTNEMDALALERDESKPQPKAMQKVGRSKGGSKPAEGPANGIDLTNEVDAVELERNSRSEQRAEIRKPGKSKKLSDAGIRTKTKAQAAKKPNEQTTRSQKPGDRQSPPSSPVRRRLKAVAIPSRTASPKMSLLPTPDPTPEPEDPYTAYVSPLLSLSYEEKVVSFDAWSSSLDPHFDVTKIAEASYSEVYRLTARSTTTGSTTNESVLKLVALKTPPNAPLPSQTQTRPARDPEKQTKKELETREEQDQWKSHVDDVHSEVKLLQNLNHIPGFTNFRELTVLQGRPSASFIGAWKAWNKARPRCKKSEFPDPSKKTSYDETQLWAVVEMHDAGTDCEKVMEAGGMNTVWEVWDVFWGVCLSVAKAEETCKFEHRDLHLENICIRSSRSRSEDDLVRPIIKEPLRRKFGFTGLDTTVIDYTLSRADILSPALLASSSPPSPASVASASSASRPSTPSSKPEVAYLDLNKDMSLFAGDSSEEYQYEIYRYMHGVVFHNDPLHSLDTTSPGASADVHVPDTPRRSPRKTPQHIRFDSDTDAPLRPPQKTTTTKAFSPPQDPWRAFHPKTNLVWAHFILHQLLEHLRGSEPAQLSSKQILQNVEAQFEDTSKVVKKAYRLYKVLERVRALLEPRVFAGDHGLGSVKELVVLALEERWLRVEDVAGC